MAPASVHRVATKKRTQQQQQQPSTTTAGRQRPFTGSRPRVWEVGIVEVFFSSWIWSSVPGFSIVCHPVGNGVYWVLPGYEWVELGLIALPICLVVFPLFFFSMYRVLAFFKMSLTRCNQVSSSWAGFHWIALKIRIKISSTFFKEQSHKLLWILISAYPDAINDIPDTFFLSFSSMALTCWRVAGICAIFLFCCPQPNNTVTVLVLFFSFAAFPCKLRVSGKKKQNNEKENGKKKWAGVKTAEGPLIRNGGRWTVETP